MSRFILTMWYVNPHSVQATGSLTGRFILTMWYVNYWIKRGHEILSEEFYINYVICK